MKKLILTLAIWIASSVPSLRAGTLVPLSLDRLSSEAQLVFHGTVRAKSCQLDPEGRIYTRVELDVSEVWKGSLTNRAFTVVHSGGIYGNRRASAPHQVEFQPDEEVVVFLAINRRGEGVCLGMAQGKFQVWRNGASKQKFVRNAFYGNATSVAPVAAAKFQSEIDLLSLDEFRRRVLGGNQ